MLPFVARATSTRGLARRARPFASAVDAGGFTVAALDNGQPTSSVTILVKAGSRYENKPGVAHALRNFGFKNTTERSALGTVREAELYGGVLSSSLSREHLTYTAEFLRGDEGRFVNMLSSILTCTRFTRYELEETVLPNVHAESRSAYADPAVHAVELAHALAFRSGLGSALLATPHAHITAADVQAFATDAFDKGNIAILGTGIAQDTLAKLVQQYLGSLKESTTATSPPTTYHGGMTRVPSFDDTEPGPQTIFIGFGAPGAPSAELAVLATHLSPTPSLKWSASTSPLSTLLPEGTSAHTVYLPYSDATLFGILIQSTTPTLTKEAGKVVVKTLKDAATMNGIKTEDIKKAAAKAKFLAASATERREGFVSTLGPKLLSRSETSLDAIFASIDNVNTASFTKAVSNLINAKPTLVAVGDTYKLPHPEELGI